MAADPATRISISRHGPKACPGSKGLAPRRSFTHFPASVSGRLARERVAGESDECGAGWPRNRWCATGRIEEREAWFVDECRRALQHTMNENNARLYEAAGRFDPQLSVVWHATGESVRDEVLGRSASPFVARHGVAPWIDHQTEREALGRLFGRMRHAIDRRQHPPLAEGFGTSWRSRTDGSSWKCTNR